MPASGQPHPKMVTRFTPRQRLWLLVIVVCYLGLGITYALATPPLESSDEYTHYPVVQYLQTEWRLPVLDPENPGRWLHQAAQPPLYYAVMAAATAWIDTGDLPQVHQRNPQTFIGNPGQVGNKNLIIHDPAREAFPWQGTVLAIYVIRLASILLGVGTVLLTARLGLIVFSPAVGLLAAALTAFNPMFLFISAAVNNDSLAVLLGTLGIYLLVKLWRDTPDPRRQWQSYAGLGLVIGLGMLTKLSLGGLLALTGLALAWQAWRRQGWWLLFGGGLTVLLVALAVSGWWFILNQARYGDPTALNAFLIVLGRRDQPLTWSGWLEEFGTFYRTYWGLFGGVNIAAPEWFYTAANAAALVGAAGLVLRWRRRQSPPLKVSGAPWLLLGWSVILFLLLLRWTTIFFSFQGRLIFPALGAINVLWAVGLLSWVKRRQYRWALALMGGLWLTVAVLLPWITIRPAYAYPEPTTAVPPQAQIDPITFPTTEGAMQLVGVEMESGQSVSPGQEPVEVVLYWQAAVPVTEDYISSVHLLGRDNESVGQVDRYPAAGMIPTSRWQPGEIYRDVYHVYVRETAVAPSRLQALASIYDPETSRPLPAIGPGDQPIDPLIVGEPARLAADASNRAQPAMPLDVAFAQGITLAGYDLVPQPVVPGNPAHLTLYWQAGDSPSQDYTVFVHLLDGEGQRVTGADAPPVAGFYPTSLWQAGDWIDDRHLLSVPADLGPGNYTIAVGLYDPVSGARLSRLDGGDSAELTIEVRE